MSDVLEKLPRVGRSFFRNFRNLRRAQIDAMIPVLIGKNLIMVSATGSGKTEAVVAPLAEKAIDFTDDTYCLYVCPTRALVNDISSRLNLMFNSIQRDTGFNISVGIRTGDKDDTKRRKCPSFLITTPESLDVMISYRYPLIRTVKAVVLDDMHEIYGTPRGLQLKVLLERLRRYCGRDFQCIVMSATIASPESISRWLFGQSEDCVIIVDRSTKDMFFWVNQGEIEALPSLIYNKMREGYRKVLTFANTRKECDEICSELKKHTSFKDKAFLHYSSLDRKIREDTELRFLLSSSAVCVATSTLELGIDIGDIDLIVMYRPPHSVFSFLQRLGRGSRRAVQSVAVLVYRDTQELLQFLALVGLAVDGKLENQQPADFYSVIVQQIFSIMNSSKGYRISLERLFGLLRCVGFLNNDELRSILSTLVEKQYLEYDHRSGFYSPSQKLKMMISYGRIHGNIASRSENLSIRDSSGVIGTVPFQPDLKTGDVILFGGKFWKVEACEDDQITVRQSKKVSRARKIHWRGSGIPAGHEIAQRIGKQMKKMKPLPVELDRHATAKIEEARLKVADIEDFNKSILHEEGENHIYYTFAGEFANRIAALLLEEMQGDLHTEVDGVSISSSSPLDFSLLPYRENIAAFIQQAYNKFSYVLSPTIFYYMLPRELRRKEVTSFIGVDEISDMVVALKTKKVRDVRLEIRDHAVRRT